MRQQSRKRRTYKELHPNPAIRPEHVKLYNAYGKYIDGMIGMGFTKESVDTAMRIARPFLAPIQKLLLSKEDSRPAPSPLTAVLQ